MASRRAIAFIVAALAVPTLAHAQNVHDLLRSRIPEVRLDEAPLETVIDWLAETCRANIVVRWERLEEYGIERDHAVSLQVRNLSTAQVLWLLLNQIGGRDVALAFQATRDLIQISTAEDLNRDMVTQVYDVRDLLSRVPRFRNAPQIEPSAALGSQSGGSGAWQTTDEPNEPEAALDDPAGAALVQLVMDTVEPDSWIPNGGRGRISFWEGHIVVYNSLLVHQRLGGPVEK